MSKILKHYDVLVEQGLKIIPLRKGTKIPACRNWTSWNHHMCRGVLMKRADCNLGILLGDIVDVEGDSEEANKKILGLIDDYPHPCYASNKSIHHLFLNPDPALTILKHQDIEFRGHRHQSVLPPSVLDNGTVYKWLGKVPFPVPPMPARLLNYYRQIQSNTRLVKPGHKQISCSCCQRECFLHKKRLSLELIAFRDLGDTWQCRTCRKVDLRPICRVIRGKIKATARE